MPYRSEINIFLIRSNFKFLNSKDLLKNSGYNDKNETRDKPVLLYSKKKVKALKYNKQYTS